MKTESNKALILRLLDMSDESYELHLFETAYKYLEQQLPHDDEGRAILVASSNFWAWWTRQWERRNSILLHHFRYDDKLMIPSVAVRSRARREYDSVHEVSSLNIVMNRRIVRSTFDVVCIQEKVKQPANTKETIL